MHSLYDDVFSLLIVARLIEKGNYKNKERTVFPAAGKADLLASGSERHKGITALNLDWQAKCR